MNKLKRIISLAFIIAFALSQFEYVKAESVEADMTNAQNAETVVASEETEHEEVMADAQVVGCKTQKEAVKELEEALKSKLESINTTNKDYMLRLNNVADVEKNQDPNNYVAHYQLSFTILDKNKKFEDIDMDSLAGALTDLYREGKIDKLKFKLDEKEGNDLKAEIGNLNETQTKAAIKDMIYEGLKDSLKLNQDTTLGNMHNIDGGIRLSKKACDNKEAFIWLKIPFRNAIVNEIKDKIEAKDIIAKKGDKVTWKDGVKLKDAYKNIQGYQGNINEATVSDESNRDTKTESEEKQEKKQEKVDYGILAPAQALRLVQHKDLPQGEKGEATRELIARGVLSGVSDTEFKGKLAINRAMLAQVLMTISKDKSVGLIDYEDIKGDEWYADAMTWALTHGIYKGYTDKTVKAAQNITRQEFASVIYNFIKEHNINMPKIKNFNYKDQDQIASWALNQVKYLDEIGLVSGENMENYNAKGTYTREELALTIYKIIKFIESK